MDKTGGLVLTVLVQKIACVFLAKSRVSRGSRLDAMSLYL